MSVKPYHKTVAQRTDLEIISYTRHWTALRHYVAKFVEKLHDVLLTHRVRVFALYAGKLGGYAMMHILGGAFIDVSVGILQRIFADPHAGSKLISVEIFHRGIISLIVGICFEFHCQLIGGCFRGYFPSMDFAGAKLTKFPLCTKIFDGNLLTSE